MLYRPLTRPGARIVSLDAAERRRRTVAIGSFDGIHLGHRAVIAGADTVVTFDPHPRAVVGPEPAPSLLTTLPERARRVASLNVRELIVVPFDAGIAVMGAQEFVDTILVEQLGAQRVRVGENFRFGRRASGDTDTLRADRRFDTDVVPLLQHDGARVSSSRIRRALAAGAIEEANKLLGTAHAVDGLIRVAADHSILTVQAPGVAIPGPGRYTCRIGERPAVVDVVRVADRLVPVMPPEWASEAGSRARIEFLTPVRRRALACHDRNEQHARPAPTDPGSRLLQA